ncbi:hypothetical protein J0S82_005552, partial [Galemys pyrenaicus]
MPTPYLKCPPLGMHTGPQVSIINTNGGRAEKPDHFSYTLQRPHVKTPSKKIRSCSFDHRYDRKGDDVDTKGMDIKEERPWENLEAHFENTTGEQLELLEPVSYDSWHGSPDASQVPMFQSDLASPFCYQHSTHQQQLLPTPTSGRYLIPKSTSPDEKPDTLQRAPHIPHCANGSCSLSTATRKLTHTYIYKDTLVVSTTRCLLVPNL